MSVAPTRFNLLAARTFLRMATLILIPFMGLIFQNATSRATSSEPITQTAAAPIVFSCAAVTEIPQVECEALVALYNSTNGDWWTHNAGWLDTNTPCSWNGVACDGGQVTELSLSRNQLRGSIPSELGNLSNLEYLSLSTNHLSGNIPPELSDLSNLDWLSLSNNELSGSIPPEIGKLSNLAILWLDSNELSGSIPPELGKLSNLVVLHLYNNELSGSIPSEIGNLSNLTELSLSYNGLKGIIPQNYTNLNLRSFYFQRTNLCEPSNAEFQNWLNGIPFLGRTWVSCDVIFLSCATVTEIPQVECEALVALYNSTNGVEWWTNTDWLDTNTPCSWYKVACDEGHVTELSLFNNRLSGSIPPELGNLSHLTHLILAFNELSGSIPPELGDLSNLIELNLWDNELRDNIPSELGNLSNLKYLVLRNNQLSGSIPQNYINLNLIRFFFQATNLCEPSNAEFQSWLTGIPDLRRTGVSCDEYYFLDIYLPMFFVST